MVFEVYYKGKLLGTASNQDKWLLVRNKVGDVIHADVEFKQIK